MSSICRHLIKMLTDIPSLKTAEELQEAACEYNWNDGFSISQLISEHQKCDLGVAITLFWLSEAIALLTGSVLLSKSVD